MSLNCCHVLQRTDSEVDVSKRSCIHENEKPITPKNIPSLFRRKFLAERSWSGNLIPGKGTGTGTHVASPKNMKVHNLRRYDSMDEASYDNDNTPRLVRSGGIRRDWSFENLRAQREATNRLNKQTR
ncbi:unnamed protein product [Amaranthus hypochondriacus]